MFLNHIHIVNFKNYHDAEIVFSPKINCFTGANGAGKTNILDAIYYLSYCKSYFSSADQQNINHNETFFAVNGVFKDTEAPNNHVSCVLQKGQKKQFSLNKKEYQRLADHIGKFPLVMISPYDQDLIYNGSDVRRKYFDSVISQFDSQYLDALINYNRALFQRNTLLKMFAESGRFDKASLDIWDDQLVNYGTDLFHSRQQFSDEFIPLLQRFYQQVSGGREEVSVDYISQLQDDDPHDLLVNSVSRDRILKYTTTGIHKDDYTFLLDGHQLKKYGSQGQQKSFYIATKLAQFEYTTEKKGFKPLLLLDDIFDKLDKQRVSAIVKLVSEHTFGQVFITDTQRDRIQDIVTKLNAEYSLFAVDEAVVSVIATI